MSAVTRGTIYTMLTLLLWKWHIPGNWAHAMAADALAPFVAKTSSAMIDHRQNLQFLQAAPNPKT